MSGSIPTTTRPTAPAGGNLPTGIPGPTNATRVFSYLRPPEAAGEIGRLGGYRVLELLAEGGMGKVFLAEDATLHRPVAMKVIHPDLERTLKGAGERFLREGRAMAAIKHDNLVTVYAAGQDEGTVYLAMELLKGETLEARLIQKGALPPNDVVSVGRQVAAGLSAIHAAGLIHRDIKPANLWIEEGRGRVKILDFGLVREASGENGLTQVGMIVGTPAYLSPEQVRGEKFDHRADLFSLGCVLYRACTNRIPFPAPTAMALLTAVALDDAIPVSEANPNVPPDLAALVMQLLEKDPDLRPQSAAEVANRLGKIARGESTRTLTNDRPATAAVAKPREPQARPRAPEPRPAAEPEPRVTNVVRAQPAPKSKPIKSGKRKKAPPPGRAWGVWVAVASVVLAVLAAIGIAALRKPKPPERAPDSEPTRTAAATPTTPTPPPPTPTAPVAPKPTQPTPTATAPTVPTTPAKSQWVYLDTLEKTEPVNWPFKPPMDKGPPPGKGPPFGKGPMGKGPPPGAERPPPPSERLVAGGRVRDHSIFMHPSPPGERPTSLTFRLGRQYTRLAGEVGFVDEPPPDAAGPVTFFIYGGGKELWHSQPHRRGTPAERFDVKVDGVDALKIEVQTQDPRGCHTLWIDPVLVK